MSSMNQYKYVSEELNKRKKDWTAFASITGMSRKTIERIAAQRNDPQYSFIYRLYELLKRSPD